MSIWGKRVDSWFQRRLIGGGLSTEIRERNAWKATAAIGLLVAVSVVVVLLGGGEGI